MLDRINLICYNKIVTDLRRYIRRKGVIMETKTTLKELVTKYVENAAFKAAAEYYKMYAEKITSELGQYEIEKAEGIAECDFEY